MTVHSAVAGTEIAITPTPAAYLGSGAVAKLPGILGGTGSDAAVVVTDAGLAATRVVARVTSVLDAAGIPVTLFSGVQPNPTTGDLAAGADAVAATGPARARVALVAVGGGSPIDAAKGIALAAVNPQRGRDLDYRGQFARRALPIVAVPTTAGTGAETNAFGVVTDPQTCRKFYVGHASSLPAAAILDPDLTTGLPPAVTAATGIDALTHALESYLSVRANPWSDGIALQVIRRFSVPACAGRLADVAFALGAGDAARDTGWNAGAAADAVAGLAGCVGLTQGLAGLGITHADFGRIAADALDDEVLANTPRQPTAADIRSILVASDKE